MSRTLTHTVLDFKNPNEQNIIPLFVVAVVVVIILPIIIIVVVAISNNHCVSETGL